MYTIVMRLTRKSNPNDGNSDDRIIVQHNVTHPNLFDVTYTTPELKMSRVFTVDESKVMDFFEDILYSALSDNDPFGHIQVYTAIHPTFIFTVDDIDCNVRRNITNMIRFALRADIKQKRITTE